MDELDKSLLAGEEMVNIEQSKKGRHNEHCLNCGTKLEDIYCHHCGQKDLPRRQSLGELGMNFVSSFFNYEGKFLLTIRYLVTRPGLMAKEYNEGRRERYFHPVRMYAFISFIFFLIFFSIPDKDQEKEKEDENLELTDEDREALAIEDKVVNESLATFGVDTTWQGKLDSTLRKVDSVAKTKPKRKNRFNYGITKADYTTLGAYDSAQTLLPESERDNWFTRKLTIRSIELNQKYGEDSADFGKDFWKASLDSFSKMLFFLLPVFALVMKMLYVRRNYFYSEHLVFSIYYYNFFYFGGSVMMLVGLIPGLGWLSTLIGWVIFAYLLIAMKQMYDQGWGKTTAKFLIFSFVFFWVSAFAFLINLFVILMVL